MLLPILVIATEADMVAISKRRLVASQRYVFISLVTHEQRLSSTATVQKIITEILPYSSGQTFSKDARDLLMECCVEFITLISSEANDISEKEAKKTIACEHVERALRDLGFGDYIPDVLAVAEEHKEQLKVRLHLRVDLSIVEEEKSLLMRDVVTGKEAKQDGTERFVRGGTFTTTAGAVSVCDGKVQCCSGISTRIWSLGIHIRNWSLSFGFGVNGSGALTAIGKWDSGFFLLS